MGYCTRYTVTVGAGIDGLSAAAFTAALAESTGMRFVKGSPEEACTWYDCETDIAAAMRATGVVSVLVSGSGEENGDRWDRAFALEPDGSVRCAIYRYAYRREDKPSEVKAL